MTASPAADRRPLVVLAAPTAAGKSAVAVAAAGAVRGSEILAVDSMQVYRGMDIGTAKPGPADRAAVVHHGLDLVPACERFTVADYLAAVTPVVRSHRRPMLAVAGTGLYLTALIDDLTPPGEWPEVRAGVERRADQDLDGAWDQLRSLDPVAASRVERGNRRRIVRALEVCLGSGRPFSSFGPGVARYPEHGDVMLGLRWQRAALAARIEQRVLAMVAGGLVDEVAALGDGSPGLSATAAQALGYKEVLEHLEGAVALDEAIARIISRTRRFAARQERWYRRDPRIRWIDIHADPVAEAAPVVIEALRTMR